MVTVSVSTKQLNGGSAREEETSDDWDWFSGLPWDRMGFGGGTGAGTRQDPVKLTPQMYKVRLENAYVRWPR